MVKEGLDGDGEVDPGDILGTMSLLLFTVAVSIDALAVGLSFRLEGLPILVPSLFMGAGTLVFTFVGLLVGNRTGKAFGKKAQIVGGLVLIGIGARIVFTHLV
jgi:putative Mn2+ efflux pump MntP